MDFVLDEVVDQGHKCAKEQACQDLPVLDSTAVVRAKGETSEGPGQSRNKVRDHKDVVPVMIIRRRNICPATASKRAEQSDPSDHLWQS